MEYLGYYTSFVAKRKDVFTIRFTTDITEPVFFFILLAEFFSYEQEQILFLCDCEVFIQLNFDNYLLDIIVLFI